MMRPYHFVAGRSPDALGRYIVIVAVVFALCWLFNAWKLGKFKRKASENPADSRRSRILLALGLCALLALAAILFLR